jgi:hypothetical protein
MSIRDRGKIKWRPASFIPLAFEMQHSMYKDQERQPKPLIDENQAEEFDQQIGNVIQHNLAVKLKVWIDGFTVNLSGSVHHVDPISHEAHIEIKPGEFERIKFEDIIDITVID